VPDEISDLAVSFEIALNAERKSPNTVRGYRYSLLSYQEWLTANGLPTTVDQLTKDNIRRWLADLHTRLKPSSVKTRFAGLKVFCGWLVDEGELEVNPMATLRQVEPPPPQVPIIPTVEIATLLKSCAGRGFEEVRDTAMIRLMFEAGVRVFELCGLTVDNVDLHNGTAVVLGKGRKVRSVYFTARTTRALDRYQRQRRHHPRAAETNMLFIGQRGPVTTDGVRKRLAELAHRAGLAGRFNPHRFRHTWSHNFRAAGGSDRNLKRLAGWSTDVMLERYGNAAADSRAQEEAHRLRLGDMI